MEPLFINKERIAALLPMDECIEVMEQMFRSLANGESTQPLRSIMWLPDKTGLMGMMPGNAPGLGVMGIKVITIFDKNRELGIPSHQGVVILFDAKQGQPLMIFDAAEITAIRTAAASAVATKLLSSENSKTLSVIGSGEQAMRHIEAILLVRDIKQINLWSRTEKNASLLANEIKGEYNIPIHIKNDVQKAVTGADIICTCTSSREPVVTGEWITPGTHINSVGSSTAASRELDTAAVLKSKLFTDCYESLFNEAGDFLIPKREGVLTEAHVQAEIGEVLNGIKAGRKNDEEITLFKSLGIAAEDIFSAWHIYQKIIAGGG